MYSTQAADRQTRLAHIRGIALVVGFLVLSVAASLWLVVWSTGGGGVRVTSWSVAQPTLPLSARVPTAEVPKPRQGLVATNDNRGLVLFGRYCDSCHPAAKQGIGPALGGPNFIATRKPETIMLFVRSGGSAMPAYKSDFLSDADLLEITKYLITSSGGTWSASTTVPAAQAAAKAAPPSAVAGEGVYAKNCEACHPGGNQGMGPSLRTPQFKSAYGNDAQLAQFLRAGKGGMPAYKPDRISDADLNELVKYVLAL